MQAIDIKEQLIQLINDADESSLRSIFEFAKKEKESDENIIVALDMEGKEISKSEYLQRNDDALRSYESGKFKTQEQILKKYSI